VAQASGSRLIASEVGYISLSDGGDYCGGSRGYCR